jgi:hypothetical protein
MLSTVKTGPTPLKLDEALHLAVTMAWEEIRKSDEPFSVHVEYLSEPGIALDHLGVWSVKAGGYQDLVCDYWTGSSSTHQDGARFANRYHSGRLAQTLGLIMKNQDEFTRPGDAAGCHGLVQIHAPVGDDSAQAAAVMSQTTSKFGGTTRIVEEITNARQS